MICPICKTRIDKNYEDYCPDCLELNDGPSCEFIGEATDEAMDGEEEEEEL